jgi:hypothetical protein
MKYTEQVSNKFNQESIVHSKANSRLKGFLNVGPIFVNENNSMHARVARP